MQEYQLFTEEVFVDKESGCFMHYVDSKTEDFILHCHEYFEIFVTVDDNIIHIVNNTEQILSKGSLVFIRPNDTHSFVNNKEFQFINLTFDKETIENLFTYLSDGFPSKMLLDSKYPPTVQLTDEECKELVSQINSLNTFDWNDKKQLKLQMRIVLANIFTKYFTNIKYYTNEKSMPKWLKNTCDEMKKIENFSIGIDALVSISQKTYEHISRSMKKFLNVTPTEFINDIRINYIANMLINSNSSISDICYESGFQNISWFYEYFKKKYGVSPKKFRSIHKIY